MAFTVQSVVNMSLNAHGAGKTAPQLLHYLPACTVSKVCCDATRDCVVLCLQLMTSRDFQHAAGLAEECGTGLETIARVRSSSSLLPN